ncbi:kinase-like protein [Conidiobolus coronatus NRRL 28638]|uniref:Kinase-like protein n=1 Tax=Conidiobolus coronatus (strain ATCC 28846 / CBS 209.66 / NRRL 28638) TaxID=796925 RepID=A0A137P955_CONC2|nr:kinase-like protein [Conidiobolus coronatus NRRL 28638]|eukprot:KXN71547.1 kinase-like protein [Conidiobolus coronatus NRRL 28638]
MSTTSRRRKRPHEWENNLYLHSQNNELIISEPTIPPPALPVVPPIVNHSRTLHPQMPPLSELQMAQYKRPKNQNPGYESLRHIQMPINDPYTPLINYHTTPEHSNYLSYHQAQLTSLPIPNYSDRVQPYVPYSNPNISNIPAPSIIARPPPSTIVEPPCDDEDGHYIIIPKQMINDRYEIISILGQGTFGKVVKCWDHSTRCYTAIKVIKAIQKYRDASRIEIRVLQTLKSHDPYNLKRCIHLNDYFDFKNHVCMTFDLLGPSVYDFLKENSFRPFPPNHIQHIAQQIISSVEFLHSLKLIHTDLKPENILLLDSTHKEVPIKKRSSKTTKILNSTDIRLIDFGSATFEEEYHSSVVSTRHYRAPEIILASGWSYPCDMWSIGCILAELFTGDALFQTHDNYEHLALMQAVLGKIPSKIIWKAGRSGQVFFKQDKLDYPNSSTTATSKRFVNKMKGLKDIIPPTSEFNIHLHDLISKLLSYDPEERLTSTQALNHSFFTLDLSGE